MKILIIIVIPICLLIIHCTAPVYTDNAPPRESERGFRGNPSIDYQETGIASFTADEMQGRKTASGRIYHLRDLVAAHPTLPFGCIVRVTNLENNKTVDVEIIDRGPYIQNRIIDLSFEAAKQLDFLEQGTTRVSIEVVELGSTP